MLAPVQGESRPMAPRYCFEDFPPGSTMSYGRLTLDREELVAFSREFDPQSFHLDEDAAKSTFAGRLIASGWQTCGLQMRMMADGFILDASSMGAPGIEEASWLAPVLPGDSLRVRHEVLEARRSSKRPEMGLARFRFETLNQRDEVVLRTVNWIMLGLREGWSKDERPVTRPPPRPVAPPAIEYEAVPTPYFEDLVVGSTAELGSYAFTEENIVDFARRYDPQPFHLDDAAAARTHFGALCASGWHTAAAWMRTMVEHRRRAEEERARAGAPGGELGPSPGFRNLRWLRPVYAGDVVAFRSTIVDKRASRSRPGWGLVFQHNVGLDGAGEPVFSFDGCVFWSRRPD